MKRSQAVLPATTTLNHVHCQHFLLCPFAAVRRRPVPFAKDLGGLCASVENVRPLRANRVSPVRSHAIGTPGVIPCLGICNDTRWCLQGRRGRPRRRCSLTNCNTLDVQFRNFYPRQVYAQGFEGKHCVGGVYHQYWENTGMHASVAV